MVSFFGLLFAVLFMSFFIWLFVSTYKFAAFKENNSLLQDKISAGIFVTFSLMGLALCYYLVSQDRWVYAWDMSQYWTQSFTQMLFLFSDPLLAILRLGGTIWFADYNSILPTFVALPLKLFGITFIRYVLVNYALFIVPTWFILAAAIKQQAGRNYVPLIFFASFTFCPFFYALLNGYIDAACLVPAALSLLLLKNYDAVSLDREQIKRDIYISSVLLCCLMFRRYFIFYIQGYVAGLIALSLYCVMRTTGNQNKAKLMKNAILNITVIGLFALAVIAVFFAPMAIRIMRTRYTEVYQAYDMQLSAKVMSLASIFGWINIFFAGLGIILPLLTGHMRKYSCFCIISLIIAALTFFQVQAMGIHHIYILVPYVFVLVCTGIIQLTWIFKNKNVKKFVYCLCFIAITSNFFNCYFPASRKFLSPASKLFSTAYNPHIRNDISVLNELADYLNLITDSTDKGIYLCSASGGLDYSIMESLRKPYEALPVRNLMKTCMYDLTDGFPVGFLDADFVVTIDSETSNQHVIKFLSDEVMNTDSPIGRHFQKMDKYFVLDRGVKVFIYSRESEFTREDREYMAEYFTNLYPGYKPIFADRILGGKTIGDSLAYRWNPKVVEVLRWLLKKELFTPEQLAAAANRPVYEIQQLTDR